jgi:Zinc-binding dehydrogenase
VTGMASTGKLELVRSIGADEVIDYTREDFTDGSRRWDVIIDTAGRRPLRKLRRALTPKGRLVIVGVDGGGRWTGGFFRGMVRGPLLSMFVGQKLGGLTSKVNQADLRPSRTWWNRATSHRSSTGRSTSSRRRTQSGTWGRATLAARSSSPSDLLCRGKTERWRSKSGLFVEETDTVPGKLTFRRAFLVTSSARPSDPASMDALETSPGIRSRSLEVIDRSECAP